MQANSLLQSTLQSLKIPLFAGILECLPADTLAHLSRTAKYFRPEGSPAEWIFSWTCGGTLATGEDGWCTEFGITPGFERRSVGHRIWWVLELCKLEGLLAFGVADTRMKDNVFIGAPSGGRWASWGWELMRNGSLQAVASCGSGAESKAFFPVGVDLRPREGRRVLLIVHLDLQHGKLEAYARITETCSLTTKTVFLDGILLEGLDGEIDPASLRPVACMDIGASVRVVSLADIQ